MVGVGASTGSPCARKVNIIVLLIWAYISKITPALGQTRYRFFSSRVGVPLALKRPFCKYIASTYRTWLVRRKDGCGRARCVHPWHPLQLWAHAFALRTNEFTTRESPTVSFPALTSSTAPDFFTCMCLRSQFCWSLPWEQRRSTFYPSSDELKLNATQGQVASRTAMPQCKQGMRVPSL